MDSDAFTETSPGELVNTDGDLAFNPDPLPPEVDEGDLLKPLTDATRSLGRLEGVGPRIESRQMLISPFMRKEAVLSSRIEGTRATLSDVYAYEAGQKTLVEETHRPDMEEVLNYVEAMQLGLKTIRHSPINTELIRDLHRKLLYGVRGAEKNPGTFRDRQNFIGSTRAISEARFVPPPASIAGQAMRELETFIQDGADLHPLTKIGLAHYQFETIHPFMDGNGRVGRLLISLMICKEDLLPEPYLYLSSFFNEHREEYTDLLLEVSQKGTWEKWLRFFFDAVRTQADEARLRAECLLDLRDSYRSRYQEERSENLLKLAMELFVKPYIKIREVEDRLGVSYNTARNVVYGLEREGVLKEITGNKRNQVFRAEEIYDVLTLPVDDLESRR